MLIDDSGVRGTTSKKIVELMYEAGAPRSAHAGFLSPPITHSDYYGIDTDASNASFAVCELCISRACGQYMGGRQPRVPLRRRHLSRRGLRCAEIRERRSSPITASRRVYPRSSSTSTVQRRPGSCRCSQKSAKRHTSYLAHADGRGSPLAVRFHIGRNGSWVRSVSKIA